MKFDFNKLVGRIIEKYGTRHEFASAIPMPRATLSRKLNNKSFFSMEEITLICELLDISQDEIGVYFYTPKFDKSN
jgi:hypothetical protein